MLLVYFRNVISSSIMLNQHNIKISLEQQVIYNMMIHMISPAGMTWQTVFCKILHQLGISWRCNVPSLEALKLWPVNTVNTVTCHPPFLCTQQLATHSTCSTGRGFMSGKLPINKQTKGAHPSQHTKHHACGTLHVRHRQCYHMSYMLQTTQNKI